MKTNKSYSKRIRVTRNWKLMSRRPGQDHYNALESGREKLSKGGMQRLSVTTAIMRRFLPGNGGKKMGNRAAGASAAAESAS